MKMNRWFYLAGLLCASIFPGRAEPASGYIATSEYGVNDKGEATGQKRGKRIWFQGANVRIENLIGDDVTDVTVGGENSWSAAPAAGRILFENQPRAANDNAPLATYPEVIRRNFTRIFAKRERVGQENINNFPCWKYSWHEDEVEIGDIKSAAQDVTYWVYADETFPFIVAHQTSTGGRQDLLEFHLNEAVKPELFAQPKEWPTVHEFQFPARKFVIEFQEDRESAQYGWKVHSSDLFEGDGAKVTRTYKQTTTQNGKATDFAPPVENLTYAQTGDAIWNRLHAPEWFTVKKTGREQLLNAPADIVENVVEGLAPEKSWIIDHPMLGTICVKRITQMPTDTSTRGVARLEFRE
jgi:hypothetical protein